MKKVIILRKIHVTMCFQTFQFEPEQKICVVMRAMRKKRNIHTSAVDLLFNSDIVNFARKAMSY